MLQMGTWKDTDNPPQTPMFGYNGKTSTKSTSLTDALSSVAKGVMCALKPSTPLGSQSPPKTPRPQLNEMGVSPTKCASSILNNSITPNLYPDLIWGDYPSMCG